MPHNARTIISEYFLINFWQEQERFYGAGDEARTRYLHLGKVALYRMSYTRKQRGYYSTFFGFVNIFFELFSLQAAQQKEPGKQAVSGQET